MKLRNKNTNTEGEGYIIFTKDGIEISYQVYSDENGQCGLKCKCYTLKDLADNFEIVEDKPSEPLIKDEKIRKAVRAWAEAVEINGNKVAFNGYSNGFCYMENEGLFSNISFDGRAFNFVDSKLYTIAELCGEGEE